LLIGLIPHPADVPPQDRVLQRRVSVIRDAAALAYDDPPS
jgi:hypothetical protein